MFRFLNKLNKFKFLIIPLIAAIFIISIPAGRAGAAGVFAQEGLREKMNELGVRENETPRGWSFNEVSIKGEGSEIFPYYTPVIYSEQ